MPLLSESAYLTPWDFVVIVFYFVFLLGMGWMFNAFNKDSSDYFRGGGAMLWWIVGATAFMTQFSAWTFTGAAGKAYSDGIIVSAIFFGNALGYFVNFLWSAKLFRQTRSVTAMDVVRDRFGRISEQLLTWSDVPMRVIYAGIWLNGLGIFAATLFGVDIITTIWVTGIVVLLMSVSGGAWAVIASDFIQMLIVMAVTLVLCITSLWAVGGPVALFEKLPVGHVDLTQKLPDHLVFLLVSAFFAAQVIKINSMLDSHRYLCAKDGTEAKWGALLASGLMILGPLIWFVPPLAARILAPDLGDLTAMFPNYINEDGQVGKVEETALIYMGIKTLPVGMMGLLVCGVFAATMSSMDSGLNRNAGIIVKNIYQPFFNPNVSEKESLWIGRVVSFVFGILVILTAQALHSLEGLTLFDAMVKIGSLVGLPLAVPLVLGLAYRKTPPWSGWSTALIGLAISAMIEGLTISKQVIIPKFDVAGSFGYTDPKQAKEFLFIFSVLGTTTITTIWFFMTSFFYEMSPAKDKAAITEFFKRVDKPVDYEREIGKALDFRQGRTMGGMCMIYGGFLALMVIAPQENPLSRLWFIFCGGLLGGVGWLLWQAAKRAKGPEEERIRVAEEEKNAQ